ncbi:hypothetical protein [Edaphobacter aggregans]|uniref:hypothetical protein n=1 Tax=Edaphobacter aggregans TaxID=570835 RepID=UPI000557CDAB|nr:hypothetical protein [Edaphobacter aggregans]
MDATAGLIVVGVIIGIAVLWGIGAAIQGGRHSEGQIISPTTPPPTACADFCRDLKLARTVRCNEEARDRALDQELANLRSILDRALITWGILTAAAVAVAAIPFIGGFISASLWAAAATAYATVLVIEGMIMVAIKQSSDQKAAVTRARNREATALAEMMMNCPLEQQQMCLAGLMPCS